MKLDNQAMAEAMHIKAVRKAAEELRVLKHQATDAERAAEASYDVAWENWDEYEFQTGMAEVASIEAFVRYDCERTKVKAFALSA